ncbi:uncharacterized protein LOC132306109 isoform X2 [Cornus florida]|uniref:uncharacterized protein LOC132306109 isoform X2 n=1 Tax=Cornus florida TaxID=4283 RepID=UPI0028A0CF1C|nr:uncharacterized protein LOC132306109 isoform X2 [Cornus florida]
MAVARLHNVSVLDSSFLMESPSPLSRHRNNQDRPSTRASSLLQMWRELEGEHVVVTRYPQVRVGDRLQQQRIDRYLSEGGGQRSDNEDSLEVASEVENECGTWTRGQINSQTERGDTMSFSSDHSTEIGEVERERVRHIFQEWMNSGERGQGSNVSHMNNCSREQCLGENERGRVRIIREWVQMTSQQRGICGAHIEEHSAEIGSQTEQIHNGLIGNHCEVGARRAIRRLCGRQALLDLLVRAERERQRELQALLVHRPVSDFAHRNRIQSLLRGRFLRKERLILDERPTSMAANELGLLRQRHTVSDLREGFLSGSDNFVHGPAGSIQSDSSSNNGINGYRNEQIKANSSCDDLEHAEPSNGERNVNVLCADVLDGSIGEDLNWQGSVTQVEEDWQEQVLENDEGDEQLPSNFELCERIDDLGDVGRSWQGSTADEWLLETSGNEGEEQFHPSEAVEVFQEQYELSEESDAHGSSNHTDIYHGISVENTIWQDTSAQIDEWQESGTDNEESDWQQLDNVEFNEWRNSTGEGMEENWREVTANQWYQVTSENEGGEHSHLQESHEVWHENGNTSEGPSGGGTASVGRATSFYFLDDDNEYSLELRELSSRRSVSNLLQSGFRESLDQLIQSYVERQGHASSDWETLSSPTLEHDQEGQDGDQNEGHSDAVDNSPLVLPSAPVTPLWDQELQDVNWPRDDLHPCSGIEWEIINNLRIDMARLQQRMNNMQRMLEACMNMQLELQRSVRQEVSAALNRSAGSAEEVADNLLMDGSKWDHVRKGICCICCGSNIDSLLYRCGHMCTCSKCADKLVQGRGKCPMCRAPIVEVIRAYSIQQ